MKINVTKDKVSIIEKDIVHVGEYNINHIEFEFSAEYTADLVKNAVFTNNLGKSYQTSVLNNECYIPAEILSHAGSVIFGVYAYKIVDEKLELRYSPFPTSFVIISGSYDSTAEEGQEITPSQFDQYMQALNDGLNKVEESIKKMDSTTSAANDLVEDISQKLENGDFIGPEGTQGPQGVPGKDGINGVDGVGISTIISGQPTIEADKTITPVTVQKTDGSSESFNVEAKNGINGQDGKDGVNGQDGLTPTIGDNGNWYLGDTDTGKPSRGEVGPSPDLSDYVKNTDYASYSKGGVIKTDAYSVETDSNGFLRGKILTKEQFVATGNSDIISKGTMENIKDDYVESSNPVITLNNTLDNLVRKNRVSDYIISLKDALKYKVFEFLVHGKTQQKTTTGKNLLPYPYVDTTKTINGITFTDNGDGTITVNGTSTENAYFSLYGSTTNQQPIIGNYVSGGSTNVNISVYNFDQEQDKYTILAISNGSFTEINKQNFTECYLHIAIPAGRTISNEIIKPMLSNEQDIPYEPYTGGQPSPSPDYPQEITTLTFDKITRCGKNLFDVNDTSGISDSVSIDDDGWININIDNSSGIDTKFANVWTYPKYNIKVNTSYKLVLEIKSHSGNEGYLSPVSNDKSSYSQFNNQYQCFFYNIVDNSTSVYDMLSQKSFDKAKTMLRTFVACYAGEKIQITFRISVLEDTSVTPQNFIYEPYQEQTYNIDLQGNEMVEIPNGVKDELVIDKYGNVSLIKNVGKIILNGSENNWTMIPENEKYRFSCGVIQSLVDPSTPCFSNYFMSGDPSDGDYFVENTIKIAPSGGITICTYVVSNSIEELKAWLQAHNTIVYYQLANPQPISLGKLSDIITTLNGTNNISINGNIPTTISTTYALDINKYIDNKLAEISTAMIEEG